MNWMPLSGSVSRIDGAMTSQVCGSALRGRSSRRRRTTEAVRRADTIREQASHDRGLLPDCVRL